MTKPESFGPTETEDLREKVSGQRTDLTGDRRIDSPHQTAGTPLESPATWPVASAERVADQPIAEQARCQADQLAAHLRNRQKDLDHREAELNSRIARLELGERNVRLWLGEREAELVSRKEDLAKQEQETAARAELLAKREHEVEKRLARLAAAEAAQQKQSSVASPASVQQEEPRCAVKELTAKKQRLDEMEVQLSEAQADIQKLHEQLLNQQQMFAEETAATRERMAVEHQQAMVDLERNRKAVQRRADHLDHCRAALKQLRAELGRMHRETLEIRLATEELWVQLSGAAPPAALTRSLGRIRTKLAEQYHRANAELAEQKKELEAIRSQLAEQHAALVEQKRRFESSVANRQTESEQQASRLVAREQQLCREEAQYRDESLRWQRERMMYQQDLRRLRAELAEREAAAVPV